MTNTYRTPDTYKYYSGQRSQDTTRRPNSFKDYSEQALTCRECHKPIIGEYNFNTRQVTTYEFDPYLKGGRIEHEHPADIVTRTDVMHRVAVELRLLYAPDPDDYHYVMRGRVK